jgi:site-specific DNA recombinase
MRTAIYVRVSTRRQAQTQTIDQQIDRLRSHAEAGGGTLPEEHVFRDDGYSGATLKRPGLDRLRDRAAMAAFDRILLTDPDRLARNYVHQVLLLDELQKHGCRVEFLDRPMSRDPHDQLLLQIRGAVAEYERTLVAERTRRGRLRRFRAGELLPWTRPPYGYRMAADRPRDPSGVTLVVAEMFAWYAEGRRSLHGLVDHLHVMGVPSPSGNPYWTGASVRGVLRNPTYTGRVYAGRTRYRDAATRRSATHPIGRPHGTAGPVPEAEWIEVGPVPAVVSRELFDRVRAKLATNRSLSARNNKVGAYLLRALVSCGRCGLACLARRLPPRSSYYVCTGKTRPARHRNGATCPSRYVPAGAIDDLVWRDLCELLRQPEAVAEAFRRAAGGAWHPQEFQARRDRLRQGQASVAGQLERLTEAYLGGVIPLPEYRRRRGELEARAAALLEQGAQLTGEAERLDRAAGLAASVGAFCERVSAGLRDATFDRRREVVELLVDRVVVTDDQVEIHYVLPTSPQGEHVRFCHLRMDYLHHPPLRERVEPLPAVRPARHLDPQPVLPGQPGVEGVVAVLRVGPQDRQPREPLGVQPGQHPRGGRPVVAVGRRDDDEQEQPQGVGGDVPLPAPDHLPAVHPDLGPAVHGPGRLTVEAPAARGRITPEFRPDLDPQGGHQPVPGAVGRGRPEEVVGRLPVRQVVGQRPPGAPLPADVQECADDLPRLVLAGPPARLGGRGERLDQPPLGLGQVTRVALPCHPNRL